MANLTMDQIEKIGGEEILQKLYDDNDFLKAMVTERAIDEPRGIAFEGEDVVSTRAWLLSE